MDSRGEREKVKIFVWIRGMPHHLIIWLMVTLSMHEQVAFSIFI